MYRDRGGREKMEEKKDGGREGVWGSVWWGGEGREGDVIKSLVKKEGLL
jgi:hypothetical protein